MTADSRTAAVRAHRRARIVLRSVLVAGVLALPLLSLGTDGPTPGPPWAPTWGGRVVMAAVMGAAAGLFLEVASRSWDRPPYRPVWTLLAATYGIAGVVFLFGPSVIEAGDLRSAASLIATAGCVLGAAAALLMLRERFPPMVPGAWIEVAGVALGVLAVASAAAGLALPPGPGETIPVVPPVRIGIIALVVNAAFVAGAAAVTRTRTTRPLARFSAGLAVVAASAVAHDALTRHGVEAAGAVGGTFLLAGFALSAFAPSPDRSAEVLRWLRPGERRRGGPMLGPPRTLLLPTVMSGVSVVVVATTLIGAELRDVRPGDSPVLPLPWSAALLALGCLSVRLLRLAMAQRVPGGFGTAVTVAGTDDVTGLADRHALAQALDGERELLDVAGGLSASVSLLIVDLDRFKDVNDDLGHDAGDRVLVEVARRLRTALRPQQMLARLAGDEFAVLLPGADAQAARRVAADLRASLDDPFEIEGSRVHLSAAVGIAAVRPATEPAEDLLRRADAAMYAAKASGAGVELYDPGRDDGGTGRLQRIDELRDAMANGDLEVHLQPQVDLRTGRVCGAEALARWRHPQDGVLLPDAFLPLAGQIGLTRPLAAIVLEQALESCAGWRAAGHEVTVSVNVTADDLRDPDLPALVERTLLRHGVPAAALVVEITEDALLADAAETAQVLERWRADGVQVAVDDYGTGYSSLAYLRELPIDEVKLDQVFAADLARARTATIVQHTVAMAHGLRLRVVAEGIEDEATAAALAELGADVGQGLLYGAAMPPERFLELLESRPVHTVDGG